MHPKDRAQMMAYMLRPGIKDKVKFASDIARPDPKPRVKEIELFNAFNRRNPVEKADGGRIGFDKGTQLKDLTFKKRQSNINKWISNNSKEAYDNASVASKRRIQLGENVILDRKLLYKDTTKGKIREYLSNLPDGATINRRTIKEKFKIKKASMGNLSEVLNEFKDKNFKFINPVKGEKTGPKFELTKAQKKLPMLLYGKTEDELTTTQRANIRLGRVDENTMTPYRRSKMYDPFSLKEYGKTWNDLTETEKDRVRAGKGPEALPPANQVKVENELKTLSKNTKLMEMFKNSKKRTRSKLTKDITLVKKILGPETNALARITQLAAAVSGDKPVDGIPTTFKKNASFIYNNLPHTKTQRELDELKIGKTFGEKSIKTIKSDIRKTPGYIVSGDYNIDEVAGATSSVRRGTTPYGIFGQIIQKDINKKDKMSFDGNKSTKEKALQDAIKNAKRKGVNIKTDKNVKLALNDFNKLVSDYEQKINKDIPKNDLKVRLFKASLDSPETTIKNFDNFSPTYKNVFLNNYKNKGYSFNVPKDIKTIPQIAKDFQDPKIIKKVAERADAGSARLYANPFFSPGVLGEAFKSIPTPLGAVGLTAGFGVDPTSAIDRASIAAEAAFAPQLVKQAAKMGAAQRIFNLGLTPAMAARVARIASPLGIASLGAEGLYQAGKFTKKRMGELKAMTPQQRQQLRAEQSALAFEGARDGGLIGKKSGQPPESGPMSQGLPGLLKRVRNL